MNDLSPYMIDVPIPISKRITRAVNVGTSLLCQGVVNIILAPVYFFSNLFTSTEKMVDMSRLPKDHVLLEGSNQTVQHEHRIVTENEDEDWLKEHRENFGDD